MTAIKDTPIGKHFDIPLYRFIWQIVVGLIVVLGVWYALVGRVDNNERDIGINLVYGQETRNIAKDHIEGTKGEPLTELQLQNTVNNLREDVDELVLDTNLNTDGRIVHDRAMAVQELQNEVILEKLNIIINQNGN